jgi:HEAT repeat protein
MSRTRFRRRLGWIGLALVVLALGYMLVDSTSRSILWGILHGESFYQGKPTNYWGRLIEQQEPALLALFFPRPDFPWNWIDQLQRPLRRKQLAESDKLLRPLLAGDPAAVPVLIELLDHEDETVRVTAAKGLRAVGPAAKDATRALARGLTDTEDVQEKSFQALAAIGHSAEPAVPTLKAIIRAGPGRGPAFHGYVAHDGYTAKWPRIAAATVLLRIAPEDEDVLPTLLQALNDREEPDKRLQTAAVETLGAIGPRAQAAVPRLLEVIKTDENGYRVERAAEALKKIDPEIAAKVGVK